ncbi:hypothetical protein ALC57_15280 [Trachymyrmex cornetzi]|uniref:Uncharacterized protein n=1 Tax=Trachymyrmex cornetzi TaxID=471704 RepID=A0A195DI31_9HYME|nr:hypothetical protein ALC57_15280 [Trachymyrmex cornetzi]
MKASYEKWLKNTEAVDVVARGGGGERDRYGGGRGGGEGGLCVVAEAQTSVQSDPQSERQPQPFLGLARVSSLLPSVPFPRRARAAR